MNANSSTGWFKDHGYLYEGHKPYGNCQFYYAQRIAMSCNGLPTHDLAHAREVQATLDKTLAALGVTLEWCIMLEDALEWHDLEKGRHGIIGRRNDPQQGLYADEVADAMAYLGVFYNCSDGQGMWLSSRADGENTVFAIEFVYVQPHTQAPDAPPCGTFMYNKEK